MGRKKGDQTILPEQRLEWLKRVDQDESFFRIATDADVDWRTVKKHVLIARSERELKDERSHVLRDALKEHFEDLQRIIAMMLVQVDAEEEIEFTGEQEFLAIFLKDHIPHSSVWRMQRLWNRYVEESRETKEKLKLQVRKTIKNSGLAEIDRKNGGEIFKEVQKAAMYDLEEAARGRPGLNNSKDDDSEKMCKNAIPVWSFSGNDFNNLGESIKQQINAAFTGISGEMKKTEDFIKLKTLYKKLSDTSGNLKKELMILKWRRIIPGRCSICPI